MEFISHPAVRLTIGHEENGFGLHQFQYEVNRDRYFWHYVNHPKEGVCRDYHECALPGKWLEFRFAGEHVALSGLRGPDMGGARFEIDGECMHRADLYAPAYSLGVLFSCGGLDGGEHVLRVQAEAGQGASAASRVCVASADITPLLAPQPLAAAAFCALCPPDAVIKDGDGYVFTRDCDLTRLMPDTAYCLCGASGAETWLLPPGATPPAEYPCVRAGTRFTAVRAARLVSSADYDPMPGRAPDFSCDYQGEWHHDTDAPGRFRGSRARAARLPAEMVIRFFGAQATVYGACGEGAAMRACVDGEAMQPVGSGAFRFRTPFMEEKAHCLTLSFTGEGEAEVSRISVLGYQPARACVTIDPCDRHQEIVGFGASSGWTIQPICTAWREENREKIADYLYDPQKGIGLTCFRFDLGAGSAVSDTARIQGEFRWRSTEVFKDGPDAPYDFTKNKGLVWMMRAARARGADCFTAYIHSAPYWMNVNGHAQGDAGVGKSNLKAGYEKMLAEYLMDVLAHFRTEMGLPFDYISPVNEPGWTWEYPGIHEEGCHMEIEEVWRVLKAVADELAARQEPCALLGPEMETVDALERALPALAAWDTAQNVLGGEITAHSYYTDMFEDAGMRARRRLSAALRAQGRYRYWQTEFCFIGDGRGEGRDYGIMPALWLAQTVHYDLSMLDACSWQWWLSMSPGDFDFKDGLLYSSWRYPGDEEDVLPSKMLWALGQYSRFIHRGDTRVRCDLNGPDDLLLSAYHSAARNEIILVAINIASASRTLHVQGMKNASAYRTDAIEGHDILLDNDLLRGADACVPPQCILTLVYKPGV